MHRYGRSPAGRLIALLVVLLIHVLLFALFTHIKAPTRLGLVIEPGTAELRFLDPLPPEPPPDLSAVPDLQLSVPVSISPPPLLDSTVAPATPTPPANDQPFDWRSEAARAAERHAGQLNAPPVRDLAGRPKPARRKCDPLPKFDWDPEPEKAGFAGILPFVRLGKRCVLGLGFFGCGIGKLPEANGELFADMDNPNTAEGSVPEVDCEP